MRARRYASMYRVWVGLVPALACPLPLPGHVYREVALGRVTSAAMIPITPRAKNAIACFQCMFESAITWLMLGTRKKAPRARPPIATRIAPLKSAGLLFIDFHY